MSKRMFSGRSSRQARCLRRMIRFQSFDRFHSAHILPIFTRPEFWTFLPGPSIAHFHSAWVLTVITRPSLLLQLDRCDNVKRTQEGKTTLTLKLGAFEGSLVFWISPYCATYHDYGPQVPRTAWNRPSLESSTFSPKSPLNMAPEIYLNWLMHYKIKSN